ncbi:hypothetical protein EMPG_10125 [Blastomyces silverae]|uniref:Uncharacterized protein n=1 Tax=Blastomyces silverae TaxID=2060906 RepID=A0A0H1B5X5_9EURO|nr:hypothetical protein EMPG_10125 [Blastomyces silverae]
MGANSSQEQNGAFPPGEVVHCEDSGTFGGGPHEILEVTKLLESVSIPCCLLGVAALRYYGAGRVQYDWEICVRRDMLEIASTLLKSEPHIRTYEPAPAHSTQLFSMIHTYPRFKVRDLHLFFVLTPDDDYHFNCSSSNIERSYLGLPYPKLQLHAQSLLDSHDLVSLTDLIDGMNLTEEWGQQNLDLSNSQDIVWAKRKNREIQEIIPDPDESCWHEKIEKPFSRAETWAEIVRTKERRLGDECPRETWATRFRAHNSEDPRIELQGDF